jgi:hypothetical protein
METIMNKALLAAFSLILASITCSPVLAQKAAEQFIPLGQSPGLSGVATLLGTIRSVDPASNTITIDLDKGGVAVIGMGPSTRIWVDRTAARKSNRVGNLDDLLPGRTLEAMPKPEKTDQAEWLKVKVLE